MSATKVVLGFAKATVASSAIVGVIAFVGERIAEKHSSAHNECIQGKRRKGVYEHYVKRPLDASLATGATIVLCPVLLVTGVLIRLRLGAPVLFNSERVGMNEKTFKNYKFRSMTNERDNEGKLLPDSARLTEFGRWLRSTSLDELPELLNIIKGDMAVVGPRPLPTLYLPYYTESERARHSVRPGLTGLAQVNGRSAIGWDKKLEYDIHYVNDISFIGDAKIVLKTVLRVLERRDIVEPSEQVNFNEYRMGMADGLERTS